MSVCVLCWSLSSYMRSKEARRLGGSFTFSCRVLAAARQPPMGLAAATMAVWAGRQALNPCLLTARWPVCMASCNACCTEKSSQEHTIAKLAQIDEAYICS